MVVAAEDRGIKDELATIEVVAQKVQEIQGALQRHTPDTLKRILPFIAEHVTDGDQTQNNITNCLWILAGFDGYTAHRHEDSGE